MKLTKREYELLSWFLSANKGEKNLEDTASRFEDHALVDMKSACEKIIKAIEKPQ